MKESDAFVRAIARGFSVLEALGSPPWRHTLAETATITGLNRATVRRVLATLVALNYCEADGRYFRLRPRTLRIGLSYLNTLTFWPHAQSVLQDLRNQVKESCALSVLDGDEIVYLTRQPARKILATNLGIGSRLPAHVVSLGRVLLAALPETEREHYFSRVELKPLTPRTITDRERLRRELQTVAKQGYAWVDGELDPAICGIAVPVRDNDGHVIAAISVNTISGTIDEAGAVARFLTPLMRASHDIRMQAVA